MCRPCSGSGRTRTSSYGDHTIIRGTRGTLYSPGGEGSPQWWFLPETKSEWRAHQVFDLRTGPVQPQLVAVDGRTEPPPIAQDDDLEAHTSNSLECIRSRTSPNGHVDTGFAHAVAVVMATRSYREGKKLYWDRKKEAIVDERPAS